MRKVLAGWFFPVLDSLFWLWTSTEDLSMLWQGLNSFLLDSSMAVAFNKQGVEGKHSNYISSSTRDTSVQGSVLGQNWVYWCDCRRSADCRVFDRFSCVIQLWWSTHLHVFLKCFVCLPLYVSECSYAKLLLPMFQYYGNLGFNLLQNRCLVWYSICMLFGLSAIWDNHLGTEDHWYGMEVRCRLHYQNKRFLQRRVVFSFVVS
jgi:hypothetical protein